ncbi:MAG: tRNA (adenosine(37)-N6)-dimethylallyltransferase MiaA [Bacilli bacterium]
MIVVITGPTGVGKTKLSIELAKLVKAEIINADSMQIYKGLDIGTAKIKEEEKEGITHHLFDIKEVNEDYNVFMYQKDCRNIINKLQKEHKNIIIVGGTVLYIKAVLYNYEFKEETIKNNYDNLTNEELLNIIKLKDNNCLIHLNNRKRLLRYLSQLDNESISTNKKDEVLYDFKIIGLTTNREKLYNIINVRVDKMISEGLLLEVKKYYDLNIRSKAILTGIGYKELYEYYDNLITLDESINLIKQRSRKYAKRQYTFLNNQFNNIKWFNTNYDNFNKTIKEVYDYIKN